MSGRSGRMTIFCIACNFENVYYKSKVSAVIKSSSSSPSCLSRVPYININALNTVDLAKYFQATRRKKERLILYL